MDILSARPARSTNKTRFAGIWRSKSKNSIAAITISPAVIAANAGRRFSGTVLSADRSRAATRTINHPSSAMPTNPISTSSSR